MAALTLLPVDTIYFTYDGYTTADALDYAQSPVDSGAYSTKVKALQTGSYYGFYQNIYVTAILSATCSSGATTASITTSAGLEWPQQASMTDPLYAMIGSEIVTYSSYTIVGTSVTALNGLVRGLGGTDDTTHTYSATTDTDVWPLTQATVTSIDHNKDEQVFNISTTATIEDPNRQYPSIVEVGLYSIPESLVSVVKYVA